MAKKGRVNVAFNKNRILEVILKNEPEGRHVLQISKELGMHRATVSRLCEQLVNNDLIKRENKQSAYHPTQKAYGSPELAAFIFLGQTARKLSNKAVSSLDNKFWNKQLCKDMLDPRKLALTEAKKNELSLFRFVNRVGAWITYIMMQAVRPDKVQFAINGTNFEVRKGEDKDMVAKTWIESINGRMLFHEFEQLDLVEKGRSIHDPALVDYDKVLSALPEGDRKKLNENSELKKKYKKWLKDKYGYFSRRRFDPENPLWSYYEMDKENFDRLALAFANLYPGLYEEFETIRKNLPDKIQKHIEWDRKYLKEQRQKLSR